MSFTVVNGPLVAFWVTAMNTATDPAANSFAGATGSSDGVLAWGGQINPGTSAQSYYGTTTTAYQAPRFDYDPSTTPPRPRGLLIEGASSNLLLQSNDWNTTWNNPAPITWNGTTYTTAPDGTNTAKQITVTAGSSSAIGQAVATGTNRTMSVWLKAGSLTSFSIGAFDSGGTSWGNNADSTCSKISGPGSVTQQVGGLWSITGLSTTEWTRIQIFRSTTYTTFLAYPGSSSGTINGTAFMWGMQMEAGNGASSLIPTGGSTGSRAADSCVMTGSNFSSWFNATEGTLLAHAIRSRTSDIGRIASVNDNTANESIELGADTTGEFIVVDGGSTLATISPGTVTANTAFKIAGAYKLNDVQAALGGTLGTADTSVTMPTVDRLMIGQQAGASPVYLNGTIALLKYWPTRLTNAQLQALTT
jgi:hypothetical protein